MKKALHPKTRTGAVCAALHDKFREKEPCVGLEIENGKMGVIPLRGGYSTGSVPVKAG